MAGGGWGIGAGWGRRGIGGDIGVQGDRGVETQYCKNTWRIEQPLFSGHGPDTRCVNSAFGAVAILLDGFYGDGCALLLLSVFR